MSVPPSDAVLAPGGIVGAIVVAAGSSSRMGGIDKAFAVLGGHPVLWWSLALMNSAPGVDEIAIVVRADQLALARELCDSTGARKPRSIVTGGARRQDSVAAGLRALPAAAWLVVHDGARPFATIDLVHRCIDAARTTGAAIVAAPLTDTVKRVVDGCVYETLDRSELWGAQTPQVFRRDVLERALDLAERDGVNVTDESTLAERLGVAVRVVTGGGDNLKITTRDDLALASWRTGQGVGT